MIHTWKITIPELTENEARKAYLYLPTRYEADSDMHYPVLYMFDGQNLFLDSEATYGKSWGIEDFLNWTELQLIVVGIECNHSPDYGRLKEYSPYDFTIKEAGLIEGKGDITMNWFINTLKPFIDENLRTNPDREHTFIAGSSMGGLMSLYALMKYNHIFSRAAALSPSLWTNQKKLEALISNAKIDPNTILYMDYGEKEFANHHNMKKGFKKISRMLFNRDVLLTSRIVPNGEHNEATWEKQLPFVFSALLYDIE